MKNSLKTPGTWYHQGVGRKTQGIICITEQAFNRSFIFKMLDLDVVQTDHPHLYPKQAELYHLPEDLPSKPHSSPHIASHVPPTHDHNYTQRDYRILYMSFCIEVWCKHGAFSNNHVQYVCACIDIAISTLLGQRCNRNFCTDTINRNEKKVVGRFVAHFVGLALPTLVALAWLMFSQPMSTQASGFVPDLNTNDTGWALLTCPLNDGFSLGFWHQIFINKENNSWNFRILLIFDLFNKFRGSKMSWKGFVKAVDRAGTQVRSWCPRLYLIGMIIDYAKDWSDGKDGLFN